MFLSVTILAATWSRFSFFHQRLQEKIMANMYGDPKSERKERTRLINRVQKRYPGTRRQRGFHGCNRYSCQLFDKKTGELVADFDTSPPPLGPLL